MKIKKNANVVTYKIKRKIIGIIICTILILTLLPTAGAVNIITTSVRNDTQLANISPIYSFSVPEDKTNFPDGFTIDFLGYRALKKLPDQPDPPPAWYDGLGIYLNNKNGTDVVDGNFNISSYGILTLKSRVQDILNGASFQFSPGGWAIVFDRFEINEGLYRFGIIKTTIIGEINGEDFSRTAISFLFNKRVHLLFER